MFYGLTYAAVRRLAYQYAVQLKNLKQLSAVPKHWCPSATGQAGIASKDWLYGFMHRHPDLTLRRPQATSLSRATAFNPHNVKMFFDKYKEVIERFHIEPQNIWNMDETALTTVQKPHAVVAQRGVRNLGAVTSAERGTLVTLALAVSAGGMCLPPFYIFPRTKFQNHFLTSAGFGADGAANPSGWMKAEQFMKFLHHFKKHAHPSTDNPVLLLLDNHESHITITGLDFCKENGIIVLSFPPHTTHKLQPLDRTVFGPIKRLYNAALDNWMRMPTNAAKTITIHDIPGLSREPIQNGASISNIQAGFRATGICPLNDNIFTEVDFLPSYVTDRPPTNEANTEMNADAEMANIEDVEMESLADSSVYSNVGANVEVEMEDLNRTLEVIQPFPKAVARKTDGRGRKRRKAAILTDNDTMANLRIEQEASATKREKKKETQTKKMEKKVAKEVEKKMKEVMKSRNKEPQPSTSGMKKTQPKPSRKKKPEVHNSDESDYVQEFCCECSEVLPYVVTNIPCTLCQQEAHFECTGTAMNFKCSGC